MKLLRRSAVLICVCLMAAALFACGSSKRQYSIVGTWKSDNAKISEITFEEDGSGNLKKSSEISVNMTYSSDGDQLTITTQILGQTSETVYTYTVTADKLTLTNGSDVIELSRQ